MFKELNFFQIWENNLQNKFFWIKFYKQFIFLANNNDINKILKNKLYGFNQIKYIFDQKSDLGNYFLK